METITYSLLNGQKRSDQYYQDVAAFADEVLVEGNSRLSSLLEAFQDGGTQFERIFELLTFGTLWRVYAGQVPKIKPAQQHLFSWLIEMRAKGRLMKAAADFLRGMLTTLFLKPKHDRPGITESATLADMDRLLGWLQATNEFDEEVRRMRAWYDFLARQTTGSDLADPDQRERIGNELMALGKRADELDNYLIEKFNCQWATQSKQDA